MTSTLLVQGNALRIPLADNSVQVVVTSPPYYGLRQYDGDQAHVWGGTPDCAHEWGDEVTNKRARGERDYGSYDGAVRRGPAPVLPGSQYCRKCGAWYGCLGLEATPEEYVSNMVAVFEEVKRVLRPDGTCWLNIGDSYASNTKGDNRTPKQLQSTSRLGKDGYKSTSANSAFIAKLEPRKFSTGLASKQLCLIPFRLALALQAAGWWVRSDIAWIKKAPMPESVTDRPTSSWEHVFLLSKSSRYYYDAEAVREKTDGNSGWEQQRRNGKGFPIGGNHPDDSLLRNDIGRTGEPSTTHNMRNYWLLGPEPFPGAHFATFPPALVEPCIKAGSSQAGACSVCGKPWERVTEREWIKDDNGLGHRQDTKQLTIKNKGTTSAFRTGGHFVPNTTGFRPACTCNAPARPCIVFDPFSGSGTTGLVAQRLGRAYIGLDLSREYHELAKDRLGMTALDEWTNGKRAESSLDALPLFASTGD